MNKEEKLIKNKILNSLSNYHHELLIEYKEGTRDLFYKTALEYFMRNLLFFSESKFVASLVIDNIQIECLKQTKQTKQNKRLDDENK